MKIFLTVLNIIGFLLGIGLLFDNQVGAAAIFFVISLWCNLILLRKGLGLLVNNLPNMSTPKSANADDFKAEIVIVPKEDIFANIKGFDEKICVDKKKILKSMSALDINKLEDIKLSAENYIYISKRGNTSMFSGYGIIFDRREPYSERMPKDDIYAYFDSKVFDENISSVFKYPLKNKKDYIDFPVMVRDDGSSLDVLAERPDVDIIVREREHLARFPYRYIISHIKSLYIKYKRDFGSAMESNWKLPEPEYPMNKQLDFSRLNIRDFNYSFCERNEYERHPWHIFDNKYFYIKIWINFKA